MKNIKKLIIAVCLVTLAISSTFAEPANPCNLKIRFLNIEEFQKVSSSIINDAKPKDVHHLRNPDYTVVTYPQCRSIYVITGKNHYAYPSIAKRTEIDHTNGVYVDMSFYTLTSKKTIQRWIDELDSIDIDTPG